jgi:hypothetical protein
MSEPRPPAPGHAQFDAICEGLEDFDTLPEPTTAPAAQDAWRAAQAPDTRETDESPLDAQILGGLITPW